MPQDAFTLRLNALELDGALKGGRINKINQPSKEELSFIIYTGKRTVKLVLNANASDCGVYFTDDERENPLVAPNFCMLLRKHLQGAEILEVSAVGFERIIRFRLACTSDFSSCERVLYAEIMGKYSNLILVENGVILGALKTTALDENCKRMILAGAKYSLPARQDKADPQNVSELAQTLRGHEGDARFLFAHVAGLAPCTAEQIVAGYRGGDYAQYVHDYIFRDEISPCVTEREGVPVDFLARGTEGAVAFSTLSEAQTYYYTLKRAASFLRQWRRTLESACAAAIKKHEKRLAQILEKRQTCADAEENRVKGELLTANLYRLTRGEKSCELENYYDGALLKISLDERLSPAQNAQNYFKRYRKQKRTLEALAPQEEEVRGELEYLRSLQTAIACAKDEEDLRGAEEELAAAGLLKTPQVKTKKKAREIPFRAYEIAGFRVLAGRNNLQNDKLIRQGAPEDFWLHAQKYHSCHVLIQTEGKRVPEETLLFAARLCARYSDGKGGRIPVDYCRLKYVKKPPKAKAGFVIYTDYKTLLVDPLEDEN